MNSPTNTEMDDFFFDEENSIIDVAASAYYKNQNKGYNEAYKKWRRRKDNPYAFNFVDNTREHTYKDGVGFIRHQPGAVERSALYRNMNLLGLVLIFTLAWSAFGPYLLVNIAALFGSDVTCDPLNGLCGATELYELISTSIIGIIGTVVPLFCLKRFLKMPKNVLFPLEVMQRDMHRSAIPFAAMTCALLNYLMRFFNYFLGLLNIEGGYPYFFVPEDFALVLPAFLMQVVLMPVLYELLIHGAILQGLRQFGDGFALLISSAVFSLLFFNWTTFFYSLILALLAGYFVLRTGSLFTGIFIHYTFSFLLFGLQFLRGVLDPRLANFLVCLLGFLLISVGFLTLLLCNRGKTKMLSLRMQKTYISIKTKLLCSVGTVPVMLLLILAFILSLGNLHFKG